MIDKMASSHRRKLLKEVVSGERIMDCDVVARIALDEILELDNKLDSVDVVKLARAIYPPIVKKVGEK